MKGVITSYREDKGFGFIKDENEVEYFFHISSVIDKNTFLNNIVDYFYSEFAERICYVVNFTAGENQQGPVATRITLTEQIFNDKTDNEGFDVRITDVTYHVNSLTRIAQGYTKGRSKPFGATAGSNGTYRLGYPEISKQLLIRFRRVDEIGWGNIEVKDQALTINSRSNMTGSFVVTLKSKLVDKLASVHSDGQNWLLSNNSILKVF